MLAPLILSLLAPLAQDPAPQPGLVFIPGGTTLVGAEVEATKERIREHPADDKYFAGETPRHRVELAPFYIAPTPVTNEMYLAFVEATGAIPPSSWAEISSELRAELITAGKDEFGPAYKFDEDAQDQWWKAHWQDEGIHWSLPPSQALEPVVFVTYEDCVAYCAWAGLRLPTEEEWERAARGDTTNEFPWGDDPDPKKAAFNATMPRKLAGKRLPVGALPNASVFGVVDMAGQVFEFTSSPARAFEGYRSFEVDLRDERGKVTETIVPSPSWDLTMVILKGGSYLNPLVNCRIDSRVPFRPDSAAKVLGFRVASSINPYGDVVLMRTQGFNSRVLEGRSANTLALSEAIGVMHRDMPDMSAIAAKRKPHEDFPDAPEPPASYAVFGQAQAIAVAPGLDPFGGDAKHAAIATVDRGLIKDAYFPVIGALVTTVDLAEPALPAGSYGLRYMPGMKAKDLEKMGAWVKGEEAPDPEAEIDKRPNIALNGMEIPTGTVPYLLVTGPDNKLVGLIKLDGGKVLSKSASSIEPGVSYDEKRGSLKYTLRLPGKSKKAYELSFSLKPAADALSKLGGPAAFSVQGK